MEAGQNRTGVSLERRHLTAEQREWLDLMADAGPVPRSRMREHVRGQIALHHLTLMELVADNGTVVRLTIRGRALSQ